MTDYYLKTNTKQQMLNLLAANNMAQPLYADDEGNEIEPGIWQEQLFAVDLLGTLYTAGQYDAEGNVLAEPVALEGYHANVRWLFRDPPEFGAHSIEVATPARVFG